MYEIDSDADSWFCSIFPDNHVEYDFLIKKWTNKRIAYITTNGVRTNNRTTSLFRTQWTSYLESSFPSSTGCHCSTTYQWSYPNVSLLRNSLKYSSEDVSPLVTVTDVHRSSCRQCQFNLSGNSRYLLIQLWLLVVKTRDWGLLMLLAKWLILSRRLILSPSIGSILLMILF